MARSDARFTTAFDEWDSQASEAVLEESKGIMLRSNTTKLETLLGRSILRSKNKKKTAQKYISDFVGKTKQVPKDWVHPALWAEVCKIVDAE